MQNPGRFNKQQRRPEPGALEPVQPTPRTPPNLPFPLVDPPTPSLHHDASTSMLVLGANQPNDLATWPRRPTNELPLSPARSHPTDPLWQESARGCEWFSTRLRSLP